jgi:HTH-type transcriptional regulator/antitoxin HigA
MTVTAGKKTAGAKRRLNRQKYGALLTAAAPTVITSPEELKRATKLVEPFLFPERRLSAEEDAFVTLMLHLIQDYQTKHPLYPKPQPRELLRALMEELDLKQADLLDIFGSRSRVSDAVNGKRAISKEQAKRLSERFKLRVEAFL